ncbi:MAG: HEPN domain-containing protein [Elusimicrobia bacterium]|nr:HEPN domain-containing protein [Candidatus Liberimonas magnetica]
MKITFKDCLEKRRIVHFPEAKHLAKPELEDAKNDLKSAKEELSKDGFKWATIKGYYSIFHSARALLYSQGYRERGHFCLYLAIKELFVKRHQIEAQLVEDFKNSMVLREDADYGRNFSSEGAVSTISVAEKFFKEASRILKE